MSTAAEGVRVAARQEMRTVLLDAARAQLADRGAVGLSLRGVARDVGMVSSALYRYFESRDALLTALIVDAYDALGTQVEALEAAVPRAELAGRWQAICTGTRSWALANPHLYALVYGSPVPGYAAPQDTVGPASRVTRLLADLLVDIAAQHPDPVDRQPGAAACASIAPVVTTFIGPTVPSDLVVRGLMAWTYLFGAVSFELFGQRNNVILDEGRDAFFAEETRRIAIQLGLPGADDGTGRRHAVG